MNVTQANPQPNLSVAPLVQQASLNVAPVATPAVTPNVVSQPAVPDIASIGTATNQQSYLDPATKAKMMKTLEDARNQYPGMDDQILQSFITDNMAKHPEIVSKIKGFMQDDMPQFDTSQSLGTGKDNINNPFGIKFIGQAGATAGPISPEGGPYAAYGTPQDAVNDYLRILSHHGSQTLAQYITSYKGVGNASGYISDIAKQLGVSPDTSLSQIDPQKLMIAQAKHETNTGITKGTSNASQVLDSILADNKTEKPDESINPQTNVPRNYNPNKLYTPILRTALTGVNGISGLIEALSHPSDMVGSSDDSYHERLKVAQKFGQSYDLGKFGKFSPINVNSPSDIVKTGGTAGAEIGGAYGAGELAYPYVEPYVSSITNGTSLLSKLVKGGIPIAEAGALIKYLLSNNSNPNQPAP